ncbi:hypothetical protein E6H15_07305 [Candidatus Bathyarchaeota archaeon]|nr:MAG: hypothetical protein E6H15_07305 [Candidatus Bathyarchaeota archaeon]
MQFPMNLIQRLERFVSFMKASDKPAGEDLLKKLESLPVKETNEFGFSLKETAMILQVMVEHQKKLTDIERSLKAIVRRA